MFSALKKLVGSEQAPGRDKNIPAGLQSMNQALQRRFAKGVQYNSECGSAVGRLGTQPGGSSEPGPVGPGRVVLQNRATRESPWRNPGLGWMSPVPEQWVPPERSCLTGTGSRSAVL